MTSTVPVYAQMFYRDTDPPNFAEYSHDPYRFSPTVEADIAPGTPWNLDVMLADPDQWAMVIARVADSSGTKPQFHCELAVDGAVVATNDGPRGALCSLRNW